MADAALNTLLDSGVGIIKYYSKILSGEKKNLVSLKQNLNQLKALVARAYREKDMEDDLCQQWVTDIRDAIFDVEDTIASCTTNAETRKTSLLYKWFIGKKISEAEEVKQLKERVEQTLVSSQRGFTNLPNAQIFQRQVTHTQAQMHKKPREKNLILLEKETETLVKAILAPSQKFEVFSIVGMAGLGKTTLAWKIFRDAIIRTEFPKVIWVSVSEEYNKKEVILSILKNTSQESEKNVDMSSPEDLLMKMVRDSLERGRFLIIFDDVWTLEDWKDIEKIFTEAGTSNEKGRALITTRDKEVATYACADPCSLRFLDEHECWKLLQLEIFGKLEDCPGELVSIGKDIAKKCKGLPLIVVVIGGILHDICKTHRPSKERREEWLKVFMRVSQLINSNTNEDTKEASCIISLGYERLSRGLKDCFLYLGMFPEDADIPVWKLKHLWIAEGYITKTDYRSLEEIAESYVNDLINKNLLMVTKTKPGGEIKACRVHDLIRVICIEKAKDKFKEIKWNKGEFEPPGACRHVSIHSRVEEYFLHSIGRVDFKNVRSFLSFSEKSFTLKKDQARSITDAFRVVRVLDIDMAINFVEFPYNLTQLILLKYVTLSSSEFTVLPKEIYKLWNVEILQVYTSSPTLKVKANIWRMMKLRHFKTKASIILISKKRHWKLSRGGNGLHSLSRLSPQSCTVDVFNNAKNLKVLGIRGDLRNLLGSKFSIMKKLEYLEKLKLVHEQFDQKPFPGLPDKSTWSPNSLKILVLSGTHLGWEHMSILGEIGTLEVLKLKNNAFKGHRWSTPDTGFVELESLHISDADLKTWIIASANATLPKLKELVLKNCHELNEVPDDLVERLELLHMDGVCESAVSSAEKIHKFMKQLPAKRNSMNKLVIMNSVLPIR